MKRESICLCVLLAAFGAIQGFAQQETMNPLARLKIALARAGATALAPAEETSLTALITAFRADHGPPAPSSAAQSAQTALETAILAGDTATASSEAQILAQARSRDMAQREADAAVLAINAFAVIRGDSSRLTAPETCLGTSGLVRLLLGLAGGPGGPPPAQ